MQSLEIAMQSLHILATPQSSCPRKHYILWCRGNAQPKYTYFQFARHAHVITIIKIMFSLWLYVIRYRRVLNQNLPKYSEVCGFPDSSPIPNSISFVLTKKNLNHLSSTSTMLDLNSQAATIDAYVFSLASLCFYEPRPVESTALNKLMLTTYSTGMYTLRIIYIYQSLLKLLYNYSTIH